MTRFADRIEAGEVLAGALAEYRGREDLVVLGLPRGGVPVASVVARDLAAPLDVVVVRKVGVPGQREVAMGAIASVAGAIVTVQNADVLRRLGPDHQRVFDAVAAEERMELLRREREYRAGRRRLELDGATVILVDDGLATGATMRAAIAALQSSGAAAIVVAVPVGAAEVCRELERLVDRVVCASTPDPFWAVGQAYADFSQTSDEEVRSLLEQPS
jgi:predicted phosphoribosyltransferase